MKHNEDENVFCAAGVSKKFPADFAAGMKMIFRRRNVGGNGSRSAPRRAGKTRRRIFEGERGGKFLQSALANLAAKNYHIPSD